MLVDPIEKRCFVDQDATADSLNNFMKAFRLGIKNQMAQAPDGRAGMDAGPLGNRDETLVTALDSNDMEANRADWFRLVAAEGALIQRVAISIFWAVFHFAPPVIDSRDALIRPSIQLSMDSAVQPTARAPREMGEGKEPPLIAA